MSYKRIVFTPDSTFSGANAPYIALHVGSIISQLNDVIGAKQHVLSSVTGDGIDVLCQPPKLSKLIVGTNISSGRSFNPGGPGVRFYRNESCLRVAYFDFNNSSLYVDVDITNHDIKCNAFFRQRPQSDS